MTKKKNSKNVDSLRKSDVLRLITMTGFFLVLDQLSKFLATKYLNISLNEGVAFGIKLGKFFTISLTAILILFLLKIILNEFDLKKCSTKILSALILGGAISNLVDRIYLGRVIDFITIPYWPTFNLADVFIVGGVIMTLLFYKKLNK